MILDNINIRTEDSEHLAASLASKVLQPVAVIYAKNVFDILSLLTLPYLFVSLGIRDAQRMHFILQAVAETKSTVEPRVYEYAERLAKQAEEDKDSPHNSFNEIQRKLKHILETDEIKDAVRSLLFAAVSSAWAAFESAAKDVWVAALNSLPIPLAQSTLSKAADESFAEGLAGKNISVGLLARHGFDLRDKMGVLLSNKFDFTGVPGITLAYNSAFGKSSGFGALLEDQNLATLEATRHLIVHRSGFVDEEYKRRTKDSTPLGEQIHIDGVRVSELVNSSVAVCRELMIEVDKVLTTHVASVSA